MVCITDSGVIHKLIIAFLEDDRGHSHIMNEQGPQVPFEEVN